MRSPVGRRLWKRDERGIALSSPIALLSAAAVVLAGIAFVSTGSHDDEVAAVPVSARPTALPTRTAPPQVIKHKARGAHKKPSVRRAGTYVEVYNNSGVSGLAGRTASRASGAGWQVVASDNWYGTIPASTVYYPARLRAEATLLARDLGIQRLKQAISPMQNDRLTVILTADYA